MESLLISFCHHLSLSYYGGGEKWLIQTAKELSKRHDVEIYALPFLLDGKPKINPKELLDGIPYEEVKRKKVKADICYITYNPLNWVNFETSRPRIGGMHSHAYWLSPHLKYGILPNAANLVNKFSSYFELRRFDAIHTVTNVYPINHPKLYYIPNFVDSEKFKSCKEKEKSFTVAYASRKVWQKGWDVFRHLIRYSQMKTLVSGDISEEELPQFFSSAHVTVVPARVDTFGLTIIESMLCETPVITTPLLTHKTLGIPLQYAETAEDFLKALNQTWRLWQHETSYDKFCKSCRSSAMTFDKKIVIEKLENMFKEVVQNA